MTGIRLDAVIKVTLPLGISFYTFQLLSYTIDVYRGQAKALRNFIDFACYISLFTQLVAGPIIRFREIADQLANRTHTAEKFARGVAFVSLGLAKKVLLANPCGKIADVVFDAGSRGVMEAWYGLCAYAFQIYFDFSAYSDMAIGLAYLFGIRIPLNFNSPYKSLNVIDFWRRWHMSLSRFLRDYLYITLGGNPKGEARRFTNLMITMLLGGLWHGAAWTFVLWGGLHGVFLVINHGWVKIKWRLGLQATAGWFGRLIAGTLTFLSVTVAWVFFRADSASSARRVLGSMAGLNGFALPEKYLEKFGPLTAQLKLWGVDFQAMHYFEGSNEVIYIALALMIVWLAPNVQQMMDLCAPYLNILGKEKKLPSPPAWLTWRPSLR